MKYAPDCVNAQTIPESPVLDKVMRACAHPACKDPFRPRTRWQRFCSLECKAAYHKAAREIGYKAIDSVVHGLKRNGGSR